MNKAVNNIEIRVLGQMRSGNHAIISWLLGMFPDKSICFLNNILHGDRDPFENYAQKELTGIDEGVGVEALRNMNKDLLVYSYEDRKSLETDNIDFVSSVFNDDFEKRREFYLGKSKQRFDIVIIRDPFNCLASRLVFLRNRGALGGLSDMELIKKNWKIVARKAIDIEEKGNPHQIVINYNKWLLDISYQEQISKSILAETLIKPSDVTSHYGGGSSFQHKPLTPLAYSDLIKKWQKIFSIKRWFHLNEYLMRLYSPTKITTGDLLTRWQTLSNDEEYRRLFDDHELLALSEQLFEEIPGTRKFVDEVCGNYSLAV